MTKLDRIIAEFDAQTSERYAECLETSARNYWILDDVDLNGRCYDVSNSRITTLLQTGPF